MKLFITSLILFSILNSIYAENLDSLRLLAFEKNHRNLEYLELVDKYRNIKQTNDTTELEYLYYLKIKNSNFSYYDLTNDEKLLGKKYNSRQDYLVVKIGMKILQTDPTDLKTLLYTSISMKNCNMLDSSILLKNRFDKLLEIIKKYGDGKSEESCLKIVKISDEYAINELINDMVFNRTTKYSDYCVIDIWEVFRREKKANFKMYYSINNIYRHKE